MSRRATVTAVILALALGCALGRATAGASRPAPGSPVAGLVLRALPVLGLTEAPSVVASRSPVADETGSDATGEHLPEPGEVQSPALAPLSKPALTGVASWYCLSKVSPCTVGYGPDRLAAAAGPALRYLLGSWVSVCAASGTCVRVQLVDVCQCYGIRLLVLYAGAFAQLAPLDRGLVTVEVRA